MREGGFCGETRSIGRLQGREIRGVSNMRTNPGKNKSLYRLRLCLHNVFPKIRPSLLLNFGCSSH